ncbi:hypothetical protein [Mesobacillus subterraneus]|uniref:Uncharacterized protein n=1 Tax=Mesobacillus subterraneus TaxID=285983 RepID=A0A427TRD2_9BACI|nr:hypothetical protein [Mesobacillus subterraneus]RSD27001.1 hypothetical protein EJA10_10670 [Mesobacillus subterraneus]
MKIESIIYVINNLMEKHQYGYARSMIINEWARLTEGRNYQKLSSEAKELFKVVESEKAKPDFNLLTEKDKRILLTLNEAVRDVKLPYAQKIFRQHRELIIKSYAQNWLTSDARFLCQVWSKNTTENVI